MNHWQRVWRCGLAVQLPTVGLEHLRFALLRDDANLLQGSTTFPLPCEVFANERAECACAVTYCLWKGAGLQKVGDLSAAFARVCQRADELIGEVAGCRLFFDWYDSAPRQQMRFALLQEVNVNLNERHEAAA